MESLPRAPGTYLLLIHCPATRPLIIGALGEVTVRRGWHLYAGSALGPGGLRARAGRHLSRDKRIRWHVDYLTTVLGVAEVWWRPHLPGAGDAPREECGFAAAAARLHGASVAITGFGASDCRCGGHLVSMQRRPLVSQFARLLAPAEGDGRAPDAVMRMVNGRGGRTDVNPEKRRAKRRGQALR